MHLSFPRAAKFLRAGFLYSRNRVLRTDEERPCKLVEITLHNKPYTIVISSEVEKSPTVETVRRIPAPAHFLAVALSFTDGGFSLRSHKISFSCHTTGEERI